MKPENRSLSPALYEEEFGAFEIYPPGDSQYRSWTFDISLGEGFDCYGFSRGSTQRLIRIWEERNNADADRIAPELLCKELYKMLDGDVESFQDYVSYCGFM